MASEAPPAPAIDRLTPFGSVHIWQDWEAATVESKLRAAIVGSSQIVKQGIESLVAATGADEVIVITDTWEHEDRLESYRRVAEIAAAIEVSSAAVLRA